MINWGYVEVIKEWVDILVDGVIFIKKGLDDRDDVIFRVKKFLEDVSFDRLVVFSVFVKIEFF